MKFKILIKVLLIKFFVAFPQLIYDEAHSKLLYTSYFALKEKSVLFSIISKLVENAMIISLMHNGLSCW